MRALWLVNQLWVIVTINTGKNRASSELLYKSNDDDDDDDYDDDDDDICPWTLSVPRSSQLLVEN